MSVSWPAPFACGWRPWFFFFIVAGTVRLVVCGGLIRIHLSSRNFAPDRCAVRRQKSRWVSFI